ncbi:MAG: beta-glucosidase BglX [Candidatus Marinimicrobia bacterium]|nr:beta-glucosidase BglX [Candidatus Neomarinimicrobiota bacterium]
MKSNRKNGAKMLIKNCFSLGIIFTIMIMAVNLSASTIAMKVDSLLNQMTLKEKIGQLNQYSSTWQLTGPKPTQKGNEERYEDLTNGMVGSMLNVVTVDEIKRAQELVVENSRLGIPLLFGLDVIHGYKTMFPIPLAQAASWDMQAIEKSARIAAKEASASGITWTFSPMVDLTRDPRWGRIIECAGEDPYLGARFGKAMVRGYQGKDLSTDNTIAACTKHFAAYGAPEAGREYNRVSISNYDLYNIYLPPYKATIDEGVSTVMNAFNTLNGVPATGNQFLVNEILRGKWNFSGFILSDWATISELITHGVAKDMKQATKIAITGGTDVDMESSAYIDYLEELILEGEVDEELLDQAVRRILTVKFELGLFDDPYKYCSKEREKEQAYTEKNHKAALEMAKKSIVLLKNENDILPLSKEIERIAVVGPLAADKDAPLGNWRCQAKSNSAVSLLSAIKNSVSSKTKINYAKGCNLVKMDGDYQDYKPVQVNETDTTGIQQAVKAAQNSDVIIAAVGETALLSGEGRSRQNIDLPGVQKTLLQELKKTGKPLVVVLFNGRPLTINWTEQNASAIVEGWLAGSQSGNALASVLFGDYNPSGKLPVTFPRNVGQIPIYYNQLNTGRPKLDENTVFVSRYIDGPNTPLYPFGYGLSYTDFKYDNLKISDNRISEDQTLQVKVDVKNTGQRKGEEIVQLYIRDLIASYARPIKELKGFKKISLEPGQKETVKFYLDRDKLSFYNNQYEKICEPGQFEVMVGGNSVDLLKTSFKMVE